MTPGKNEASSPRAVFKNILQGSGIYSLAIIAPNLVSVVMLPIITRHLNSAEYGILDLLQQVSIVLSLLLGAGFSSALGYFYFEAEPGDNRRRVVGTTAAGSAALGAIAGLICWPFAGALSRLVFRTDSAHIYLLLVFATMPLGFLGETLLSWLRVENRPGAYLAVSLLRLVVTVASILLFIVTLGLRVWGMLFSSAITIGLTACCLAVYCIRVVRPTFDRQLFVRMAKFSAPIGFGGVAVFIMNFGDRLMLPRFVTFDQLGLYALAYKIGMLISFLYGSFHVYWSAQVYNLLRHQDWEIIFARTATYVIAGLAFCGLGLTVFARPILQILVAPPFQPAAALVPVIVAAYCFKALGDFLRCLFIAHGRPACDAISNWIGAAICVAAYAILIPPFGIWGAATATLVAFAAMAAISTIWTYRISHWKLEAGRLVKTGAALGVALVPFLLQSGSSLSGQVGAAALSIIVFPAVLLLARFFTPGEFEVLRTALQSVRRRRS
jgi:O-antigen/teichoic acid export membrane protein